MLGVLEYYYVLTEDTWDQRGAPLGSIDASIMASNATILLEHESGVLSGSLNWSALRHVFSQDRNLAENEPACSRTTSLHA